MTTFQVIFQLPVGNGNGIGNGNGNGNVLVVAILEFEQLPLHAHNKRVGFADY